MGRKIPGKKHRGVKDPHEQQWRRNEELKNKINMPPSNPDEQEIPKSIVELSKLIKLTKEGNIVKRKRKKRISRPVSTKENVPTYSKIPIYASVDKNDINFPDDKLLPLMEQKTGESEEHFLNRIQSATDELMDEAQMEAKFNVKVKRNKYGHVEKVELGKFNKNDLPEGGKRKQLKKKIPKTENKVKRLSKRKRNKLKKTNHQESIQEVKYDHVKFGEVVHGPPNFKKLPRGVEGHKSKGKNLLLNSFLGGEQRPKNKNENVSMSMKQKLENQRKEVVAAYRLLKASKGNHSKM